MCEHPEAPRSFWKQEADKDSQTHSSHDDDDDGTLPILRQLWEKLDPQENPKQQRAINQQNEQTVLQRHSSTSMNHTISSAGTHSKWHEACTGKPRRIFIFMVPATRQTANGARPMHSGPRQFRAGRLELMVAVTLSVFPWRHSIALCMRVETTPSFAIFPVDAEQQCAAHIVVF